MALNFRKFIEGLRIVPKAASTASEKGDLDVVSGSGKLNYHNGTTASPIVTEAHSATLTNKTIDGDDNTVQDLGLTSLKTVLADADKVIRRDASGIVTSGNALPNSSQIVTLDSSDTLTNKTIDGDTNTVQDLALTTLKTVLADANKVVRRNAAGIVVSDNALPNSSQIVTLDSSDTLTNKTIDGDNNTLQDIGIASLKTILGDANKVIRRNATGAVVSDNALPNSSQIVTIDSSDTLSNKILNTIRTVKSIPTNTAGALALPSTGYAVVSANINTIAAGSDGSVIILTNTSASAISLANEFSGTGNGIRTGSGGTIFLLPNTSLILIYNSTAPGYWYVVGGVGGSSTFNSVGSNAAVVAYNAVYLDSSSLAQQLDATTDTKVEFVGVSLDAGGGSVRVQVAGEVDIPAALIEGGSFTIGKPVYASVSNPGKYQSTLPSTAGNWVIPVGIATTATKMAINGAGSSTAVKLTSETDPYVYAAVTAVSANTTLTNGNSIVLATGGAGGITVTLPAPTSGKIFNIKKVDSGVGVITISPPSGTIDGFASKTLPLLYDSLTITSDGTNFFII